MALLFQAICTSFKVELLTATHDFTTGTGDTFNLALYAPGATIDETTTVYTTVDEVVGSGYVAGGSVLTVVTPTSSGTTAFIDFADLTFSTVTVIARAGLIYNTSKANRAVCVLDFGRDVTKTAANLVIAFPVGDSETAVVRLA